MNPKSEKKTKSSAKEEKKLKIICGLVFPSDSRARAQKNSIATTRSTAKAANVGHKCFQRERIGVRTSRMYF
jgi:hypothetical protein